MQAEILESVVVALLAVNNYPLEKAWKLLPALREAGLTSPAKVPDDLGDCTVKLASAGYDRGLLTAMLAERIQNVMASARRGDLAKLEGLVKGGKKDEAVTLLCTVRGIGPKVAATTWMLCRADGT